MTPGWIFSLVASLAREFHFSEDFVLYELPFSRATGYLHCLEMGSLTHWPVDSAAAAPETTQVISEERLREIFAD